MRNDSSSVARAICSRWAAAVSVGLMIPCPFVVLCQPCRVVSCRVMSSHATAVCAPARLSACTTQGVWHV